MSDRRRRRILLPEPLPHQVDVLTPSGPAQGRRVRPALGQDDGRADRVVEGHGPRARTSAARSTAPTIWWVAPNFPQGVLIWRDLKKALRGAWVEKREKEMRIVLPGGGTVTVKSADDPDALRGVGLDGVVLDESRVHAARRRG